jgi:hypothetical protein
VPLRESADANFFALVHHVLDASLAADTDRRDNRRRGFSCLQFVAPYIDGRMPTQSEFKRVLCRDLSPTGFSFVASDPPNTEYLVVALGAAPFIFVSAEIVHQWPDEAEGKPVWIVGCRFVSRIKTPEFGELPVQPRSA